jgi:hypothetical protein
MVYDALTQRKHPTKGDPLSSVVDARDRCREKLQQRGFVASEGFMQGHQAENTG